MRKVKSVNAASTINGAPFFGTANEPINETNQMIGSMLNSFFFLTNQSPKMKFQSLLNCRIEVGSVSHQNRSTPPEEVTLHYPINSFPTAFFGCLSLSLGKRLTPFCMTPV